eukprot:symbB.v1.2.014087.t1/scaffold1016.1/size143805/5
MYGQTGSGKTFSLFGRLTHPELRGLAPRAAEDLVQQCLSSDTEESSIQCSFLEIYRERMRDLLHPSNQSLRIKEIPHHGLMVDGLTQDNINSSGDILKTLDTGNAWRSVAATRQNQYSSRSHAIFTLYVSRRSLTDSRERTAKLSLVDLAGSERVSRSHCVGETLEEAKKINASLTALGKVIDALVERRTHVPVKVTLLDVYVEGAASSAPDDPTAGEADTVLDVASGIALVEPGVEQTIVDTPDNPVDDTVKEEEVDFDPGDETDIVGSFLGVEVTTGDLIEDVQELDQPSSEAVPEVHAEGAASSAPLQTHGSAEASASAEPDTTIGEVAVGSSPSAPSKPPRTRGARGGKDKIYKDYRRVFYQGFEQLKAFLAEHLVSRPGRSNFILQWVDFERAPQRLQELLINWQFFRNSATIQQILCEA